MKKRALGRPGFDVRQSSGPVMVTGMNLMDYSIST